MDVQKHTQARLYPTEVVTLTLLFALKGVGNRAFYQWLRGDYCHLFPKLPERTHSFHLFNPHYQFRWSWSVCSAAEKLDSIKRGLREYSDQPAPVPQTPPV